MFFHPSSVALFIVSTSIEKTSFKKREKKKKKKTKTKEKKQRKKNTDLFQKT